MTAFAHRTDAELASLARHKRGVIGVMAAELAEVEAEQVRRLWAGQAAYEPPAEIVPWYPQRHCECCDVPTPEDVKFCAGCVALHGERLVADGWATDVNSRCPRAQQAYAGRAEGWKAPPPDQPRRLPSPRLAAWATAASYDPGVGVKGTY